MAPRPEQQVLVPAAGQGQPVPGRATEDTEHGPGDQLTVGVAQAGSGTAQQGDEVGHDLGLPGDEDLTLSGVEVAGLPLPHRDRPAGADDQGGQPPQRGVESIRLAQQIVHSIQTAQHDLEQQVLLVAVVVVEGGGGDAERVGHVGHGHVVVAALHEELGRAGADQLLAVGGSACHHVRSLVPGYASTA
jgi:hypothetical protein